MNAREGDGNEDSQRKAKTKAGIAGGRGAATAAMTKLKRSNKVVRTIIIYLLLCNLAQKINGSLNGFKRSWQIFFVGTLSSA